MAQVFYTPQFQALSSSGAPLPGAKLYFFKTGTVDATPVYGDAARTSTLSNPLIADSQGRFSQLYPNPLQVYRVRLTDSANVQQWQEDGVSLRLFMRTKAEIDANVLPINYAYEPGNVLRYGANPDPDSGVSSTQAFQDATRTGHPVRIPEGTFQVTGVTATGKVVWSGEGASSIIRSDGQVLLVTGGSDSCIDNLYLENITAPWVIKRDPNNWLAAPVLGQHNGEGYQPTESDADIWSTLTSAQRTKMGPYIEFAGGVHVMISRVSGRHARLYLRDLNDSQVSHCNLRGGGGACIHFDNHANPQGHGNQALGNIVRFASNNGIYFEGNDGALIEGNTVEDCGESGIKAAGGDASRRCIRTSVIGNRCNRNYYDGIDLVTNFPVTDVEASFAQCVANYCYLNGGDGINMDGAFNLCDSNMVLNSGRYGIWGVTRLSKISNNFVINSAVSGGGEAGILANGAGNFLIGNYIWTPGFGVGTAIVNGNGKPSTFAANHAEGGAAFNFGTPGTTNINSNNSGSSASFGAPPLSLGGHYLWVDAGGRLRIKHGTPTTDGDGVIVGTQT